MEIGERLKIARTNIGYTLDKVQQISKMSKSSISEFENSRREPKFSQLSKLAEIYRRPIEFFLTDEPLIENVMLWRDEPEKDREQVEAKFRQLCQQYHKLEVLMNEVKKPNLPEPNIDKPGEFDFTQAECFAQKVQKHFLLGDVPIAPLKQRLEETYDIKIFYLNFSGSAISTVSEEFGPAILLNEKNKQWRRSYDLVHELFHILTWKIFAQEKSDSFIATKREEQLANVFASCLLMPKESIDRKIKTRLGKDGQVSFDQLDDIARHFDVSLPALLYRIANIYNFEKETLEQYKAALEQYLECNKPRYSRKPDKLPERYCHLAQWALREGKLSLMQFAKYMGISYKKAQEYLTEDEDFKDEKVQISVA